ncbi:uncharacterized protein MELLADRAFT_110912 [Melampsora larici-populina 98AG31]|uniref:Uncharacterized protein n=1 Tax=Melampsora larici-populina (strain 98AG31 / pathotype 3-4-7) TaxID=747676 RepID=F4S1F1_MELLP|nr:uncharacterized protein MELLADRAFT_110912 [Melampsora larici-populina 98AG31]EGG01553.1 hypothetical protein MELLADRAFT_110912 [Melampsora larici-populina 98AG31]
MLVKTHKKRQPKAAMDTNTVTRKKTQTKGKGESTVTTKAEASPKKKPVMQKQCQVPVAEVKSPACVKVAPKKPNWKGWVVVEDEAGKAHEPDLVVSEVSEGKTRVTRQRRV